MKKLCQIIFMMKIVLISLIAIVCDPLIILGQGSFNAYFGSLHSHTSNSDGAGEPEDAYNYARFTAGLDFLAVTDHLEQIGNVPLIDPEWSDCQDAADNATVVGTFVGIAGWEWGSPLHGHVNVFNTADIIDDVGNLWYTTDLPEFYNWVLNHSPAFAQFNHPGEETYFTNWNSFAYVSTALDNVFSLIEFQSVAQASGFYELSLNNGWRLSPVWNQDNHSADWGTKNDCRTGIWATTLSRPALFEAIMAGRTFATMDKNASVWIDLNNTPMGGQTAIQPALPLHIHLADNNSESWISIQLVTSNGVMLDLGPHTSNLDTTFAIDATAANWIFVRAIQSDSNYLWSAPVYLTGTLTSFEEARQDKDNLIYPNPATTFLTVMAGNGQHHVAIYDLYGRLHYSGVSLQNSRIDIGMFSAGVYLVKVQTAGKTIVKKVVINPD